MSSNRIIRNFSERERERSNVGCTLQKLISTYSIFVKSRRSLKKRERELVRLLATRMHDDDNKFWG